LFSRRNGVGLTGRIASTQREDLGFTRCPEFASSQVKVDMHILLRGGLSQRVRLASGLVLFAFASAHFINHAMGLVSLELMHEVQEIRTSVTRSAVGTTVLASALAVHIALGLYKLATRRTLRLPLWEVLQIGVALLIPFLLFPHIVNTRIAHFFFGVSDTYLYELFRLWPDRAVLQSLLLLLVWTHGCIGLHYWLRLSDRYDTYRPVLWTIAGLVPVLALAGFATSGQLTVDVMRDPASLAQLKERSHWPSAADGDAMAQMRDTAQYVFGLLLVFIASFYLFRHWRSRAKKSIAVTYRDGPTVEATGGMTLLELSRASSVPHASVCGGRARCFTCRVKIESGLKDLPAPNPAEAAALRALEAPENVRLACQLRPTASLTITILNRPTVPGPVQVEFIEIKSVVAAHARAVLRDETVDMRSGNTDELTSWFAAKIRYHAVLPELNGRFSLYGGRVDFLDDRAVAALALGHEGHAISLYVMPKSGAEAVRGNRNGYSVVGWGDADLAYFAVSDVDRKVLDELQDAVSEANHRQNGTVRTTGHDVARLEYPSV
jgi:ferredoxin